MALCGPWAQDKRGASRWERSYREGHFCRVAVTPLERDKPKELVLCRRWNKALWVSEKVWVFFNSLWDFLKFGCTEEFTWEQRHRTGAVEQRPWHSEVCKDQPLTGLLCSASQKNREHRLPGPEASKPFASKWTDSSSWNYRVWTNLWCPSQVFGLYPWSCQLKHRTVGLQTFTFFRLCLCSKVFSCPKLVLIASGWCPAWVSNAGQRRIIWSITQYLSPSVRACVVWLHSELQNYFCLCVWVVFDY